MSVLTTSQVPAAQDLSASPWYVLHAKPHQEQRLTFRLQHRVASLEVFVPLIEVSRRQKGRRRNLLEPLFPGYLFATIPAEPRALNTVRWTPGIKRILGCGDVPVPVPEGIVEEIRARVADYGFVRLGMPFRPGDKVRLSGGPLAGLEGIFERPLSRAGRVRVLLGMLSRTTPIDVDVCELERF